MRLTAQGSALSKAYRFLQPLRLHEVTQQIKEE